MQILSIDAKDLYDANHAVHPAPEGYSVRDAQGELRLKKFINTFDYSLELIKLRQVYEQVARNSRFSTWWKGKEYSQQVINVTFKYAYRAWNKTVFHDRTRGTYETYVKAGYRLYDLEFNGCLAFCDDQLVGVETGVPVDYPVSDNVLGTSFYYNSEKRTYEIVSGANPVIMSREDLRHDLYENGFVCDGIRYVRFKRSSGSSRVGKCLFINDQLYSRMHTWEKCGLTVREGRKIDLATWEASIALTMSSIIGTVDIQPENILLIEDYESEVTDDVLAVGLDGTWLTANPSRETISNCIWDGQSLLDTSLFGDRYAERGMLLLRTRFFKSACFNTDIQKFFADHGITDVSQLKGQTRAKDIKDIKMITTPSSVKFLKFGSFDQWLDRLEPQFGIVKYEKASHFFDGRMVQAHYQLLNTLHMSREDVEEFLEPTRRYLEQIDDDPAVLRHHVKRRNDLGEFHPTDVMNDVVFYFLGLNEEFSRTRLYNNFKRRLVRAYVSNVKKGHVLIEGTYATLFSNPYEMLLAAVGRFDGTSVMGTGNVSCSRFGWDRDLLGSRSPHVAAGNILLTHNVIVPEIETYFHLSPQIVCINSIGENILERLSGADMDSDTMLLTDNQLLIDRARQHYEDFLVPTTIVPSEKKQRIFTDSEKADLDYVTSGNRIGEIVNLSQELNSYLWDKLNDGATFKDVEDIYCDIAKLDVLSTIEIDRAKRECVVDASAEMKKIRQKYLLLGKDGRRVKPHFFAHIARSKGYYNPKRNHYRHHKTTMDYLQEVVSSWRCKRRSEYLPLGKIFKMDYYSPSRIHHDKAQSILDMLRDTQDLLAARWAQYREGDEEERKCLLQQISELVENRAEYIKGYGASCSTIYYLTQEIEKEEHDSIRQTFFQVLFGNEMYSFRELIDASHNAVPHLVEDENGEIQLYGIRYRKEIDEVSGHEKCAGDL